MYLFTRRSALIILCHCRDHLQQEHQKAIPTRFCCALAYTGCYFGHWGQIPLFSMQYLYKNKPLSTLMAEYLHCSKYKGQTETLSLNWTLSHFITSWQKRALAVLPEIYSVPRGPKNRLQTSSDLGHPYVPFHPLPGVSLPLPSSGALMVRWGPKALEVLKDTQKRLRRYCNTWLSQLKLWTCRGYSSSTGVFSPKCPYPAKSG